MNNIVEPKKWARIERIKDTVYSSFFADRGTGILSLPDLDLAEYVCHLVNVKDYTTKAALEGKIRAAFAYYHNLPASAPYPKDNRLIELLTRELWEIDFPTQRWKIALMNVVPGAVALALIYLVWRLNG